MGLPVHRMRLRLDGACIADAAAAVFDGVGVDALEPAAGARHADQPILADDRGEVAADERRLAGRGAVPGEDDDARLGIAAIDPLEALGFAVAGMERRRLA